jgi:hypothetical protein
MSFHFTSQESHTHIKNGKPQTKEQIVNVRNGTGTKTVIVKNTKGTHKSTRKLTKKEIKNIQGRKFMPTLFSECYNTLRPCSADRKRNLTRKGSR